MSRIKNARINRGMTQEALALKVGISSGELSHYENGNRKCPKNIWDEIFKVLHPDADFNPPFKRNEVEGVGNNLKWYRQVVKKSMMREPDRFTTGVKYEG